MPVPTGRLAVVSALLAVAVVAVPVAAPGGIDHRVGGAGRSRRHRQPLGPPTGDGREQPGLPSVLPLNGEARMAWTVTNPPAVSPLLNAMTKFWSPPPRGGPPTTTTSAAI